MIHATINLRITSEKVIGRNSGEGGGLTADLFTKSNSKIQLTYTLYFLDIKKFIPSNFFYELITIITKPIDHYFNLYLIRE